MGTLSRSTAKRSKTAEVVENIISCQLWPVLFYENMSLVALDQEKTCAPSPPDDDSTSTSMGGGGDVTSSTQEGGGEDGVAPAVKIAPTLSMLPLGPLVSAVFFLTEADVAQLLRTGKAMNSSPICSNEFWRERSLCTFGRHLECIEHLDKKAFRTFLRGKRHALDETIWARDDFVQRNGQLLGASVGASSQDMDDEVPRHTLMPSACWMMMHGSKAVTTSAGRRCQRECGCMSFQRCYWSSAPSAVADKDEWLEYDLADDLAVVSSFALTPYTSFWQPDQPTYNPVEAYFQLTHPGVNQGKPYYESPRFRVEGSMTRQQFDLPQPTLSFGGIVKIFLLRMAQRQTLGPEAGETANHYHICISYAALQGAVLRSCRLVDTAEEPLLAPTAPVGGSTSESPLLTGGGIRRAASILAVGGPTSGDPTRDASPRGGGAQAAGDRPGVRIGSMSGATRDDVQGGGSRRARGNPSGIMRIRWAMTVRIAKCLRPQYRPLSELPAGSNAEEIRVAVGQGMTMLKFDDTPCLEVMEEYSRKPGWQRARGSRLKLTSTSGAPFPGDAVLLKDFSDEGSLLLLDRSD